MRIGRITGRLLRIKWSYWIAAVWMAGVVFYWWHRVPIVPELVIPLEDRQRNWGYTASGDLVISRGRQSHPSDIQRTGGPVDVVSSTTGEVLAQRLKKGDYILAVSNRHIAAADVEQIHVVDFESGNTVFTLPAGNSYPTAVFSFDGQRIAIARGREVTMHVVETGEQLWNRKLSIEQSRPLFSGQTAQETRVTLYSPFQQVLRVTLGFFEHTNLRASDGQHDARFDSHDHFEESHDGRLAIVARASKKEVVELGRRQLTVSASDKDQVVYDLAESRELWAMEGEVNWRRFSTDSSEIWEFSWVGGRPTMRRWRAVDGTPIAQQDLPLEPKGRIGIASRDARFFVTWNQAPGLRAPAWLQTLCKNLGFSWNGEILPAQEEYVLVDHRTGIARLVMSMAGAKGDRGRPENLTGGPLNPERFIVPHKERITVYRFDAPRNWVWLARWGIWPVLLVISTWGWGAVSARRSLSHGR